MRKGKSTTYAPHTAESGMSSLSLGKSSTVSSRISWLLVEPSLFSIRELASRAA